MKTNQVDRINVVLIIASLGLALIVPFRLFLFSYAVLGPIHYLTEINWLHQRNFFVKQRKWIWLFMGGALLISIPVLLNLPLLSRLNSYSLFTRLNISVTGLTDVLLLTLFFFSIGLLYLKHWRSIMLFLLASLIIAKLITKYVLFSYVLVGLFLPTLVHVYLFTLLFMLMGTLQSKSRMGFVAIFLLVLCPFIIWVFPIDPSFYRSIEPPEAIDTTRNFRFIQQLLLMVNNMGDQLSFAGIRLQMFLAFCYTYHYLNWFSKTSLIGWHKNLSALKLSVIFILWASLVVLFWFDYEKAYLALFFLALLHIVLEFPLNVASIRSIGASLMVKKTSR
ncbi:MAG: hypothetical protein V4635_06790 [Bacteroidota bacterium]